MHLEPTRVLLIEDDAVDAEAIRRLLKQAEHRTPEMKFDVEHVLSRDAAEQALRGHGVDIVLADLRLPGSDDHLWIRDLVQAAPHVPVVVQTGMDDDQVATETLQVGAQDYLVKGQFDRASLVQTMRHAIERHRTQLAVRSALAGLVRVDAVTGCLNRAAIAERLGECWRNALANGSGFSGMLLRVDHIDRLTERAGDGLHDLLRHVGGMLRSSLGPGAAVAHVGPGRFLVLFEHARLADAVWAAERLKTNARSQPAPCGGEAIPLTLSAAAFTTGDLPEGLEMEVLVRHLSEAIDRRAPGGSDVLLHSVRTEADWSDASELHVHARPLRRASNGEVAAREIRIHGRIGPYALPQDTACVALSPSRLAFIDLLCLRRAVDAARQLGKGRFHIQLAPSTLARIPARQILDLLKSAGDASWCIEVDEQLIVDNETELHRTLLALRESRVGFSVCNVTWSCRALESLVLLRPDVVRLRPGWAGDVLRELEGESALRRAIHVVKSLGAAVIVDGLASEEEYRLVRSLGATLVEGPYWDP